MNDSTDLIETLLDSRPVYLGKLVKLHVDTVQLPDGSRTEREIIRHPGAVAMVPLLDGDNGEITVVLVQQYRHAAAQVTLEIPAGGLEPGEDPLVGAVRELQEEIGYKPGKLELLASEFPAPSYTTECVHLFLATELTPSRLDGDADEFMNVVPLPLDEALRRIESGAITDAKTMIALLLVARRLGR
ncbi:MAG: NUDIX hydrolase [Anaerolineae bacterium]|nr:NUDIX hydrolase [Anaerolineae bacterium]